MWTYDGLLLWYKVNLLCRTGEPQLWNCLLLHDVQHNHQHDMWLAIFQWKNKLEGKCWNCCDRHRYRMDFPLERKKTGVDFIQLYWNWWDYPTELIKVNTLSFMCRILEFHSDCAWKVYDETKKLWDNEYHGWYSYHFHYNDKYSHFVQLFRQFNCPEFKKLQSNFRQLFPRHDLLAGRTELLCEGSSRTNHSYYLHRFFLYNSLSSDIFGKNTYFGAVFGSSTCFFWSHHIDIREGKTEMINSLSY